MSLTRNQLSDKMHSVLYWTGNVSTGSTAVCDAIDKIVDAVFPPVTVKAGDKIHVSASDRRGITWRRVISAETYGMTVKPGYVPYMASNGSMYRAKVNRVTLPDGTQVAAFKG